MSAPVPSTFRYATTSTLIFSPYAKVDAASDIEKSDEKPVTSPPPVAPTPCASAIAIVGAVGSVPVL